MPTFDDFSTELVQRPEPAEEQPTFRLEVIEGPATGTTVDVDPAQSSRLLLGHFPSCGVPINDRSISRRHATIDFVGQRLRVTDLDSTNGTFVDGTSISVAYLNGGETIRMGATAIRVTRGASVRAPVPNTTTFGRMLGGSLAMRKLHAVCERLANSNVSVIIEGETGTGKEVLAEALHEKGPRAAGPFIVLDCTTPANLIEADLFGHEAGAFPGADGVRQGVFELAHGGTLLLDEIGELDLSMQSKLLRVVERGEVRRLGGQKAIPVDVRILAATRRDLDKAVHRGEFRDDLMHRIAVARIELPPLRDRRGDVRLLAQFFWHAMGEAPEKLPADLLFRWEGYAWPGNVRELRNAVARYLALGEVADSAALVPSAHTDKSSPDFVDAILDKEQPYPRARDAVLATFEQRFIERQLVKYGGDAGRAAAASGIGRRYFNIIRSRQKTA